MSDLVDKAKAFATAAHGAQNQKRKYTNENYIDHPAAVVALLREHGITDEATLCAAWMHDVIEDCPVALCEIGASFGRDIENIVCALTDPPTVAGGPNRAARKAATIRRLSIPDSRVHNIKVADLIDNTKSIAEHGPDFAKVYMREKADLLPVLTRARGSLWRVAWMQLHLYEERMLAKALKVAA